MALNGEQPARRFERGGRSGTDRLDHKSASTPFGQGREGPVDLTVGRGVKDKQRLPESAHGGKRIGRLRHRLGAARVHQQCDDRGVRNELMQQTQAL